MRRVTHYLDPQVGRKNYKDNEVGPRGYRYVSHDVKSCHCVLCNVPPTVSSPSLRLC